MKIFNSITDFLVDRNSASPIVYVPTMGNLHEGHLSLIKKGKELGGQIITSIFINPLQFNNKKDLDNYPKTLNSDVQFLKRSGCNYLYLPDDKSILNNIEKVKASKKSKKLCGINRPGHFDGVVTILNRFFNQINPDIVIFGKKDYQQYLIVKDLINDKKFNIRLIGSETIRDKNGLALSSRNNLLSNEQKTIASELYKTLKDINKKKKSLSRDLLDKKIDDLSSLGFEVDYLTLCNAETLEDSYEIGTNNLLCAIAATISGIRLIDNIILDKLS